MSGVSSFIGTAPFGPIPIGGGSGGGGGIGTIRQFSAECGQPNGPTPGLSTFTPAGGILAGATMFMIVVNNIPEFGGFGTNNAFVLSVGGEIDRAPNVWMLGDKIVGYYQP